MIFPEYLATLANFLTKSLTVQIRKCKTLTSLLKKNRDKKGCSYFKNDILRGSLLGKNKM